MKRFVLSLMLMLVSPCFFITTSHSAIVVVDMQDFVFSPVTVRINVGDTIKWKNEGREPHTTTSGTECKFNGPGEDSWDSGLLNTNQTFERVFNKEGEFPYFCIPHCGIGGMVGTVIVEAGGPTQNGTQWSGPTSFSMIFTSISTDASGNKKFTTSRQTFKGTIQFITIGDTLLADEGGCFIKFLGDNGKSACFNDKAFLKTFNLKSKTDQLSLIGTGAGVFSKVTGGETETGPAYLDTKGTFRKDKSGNVVSIDLKGKIAGGASDDDFVFSGSFRSTLKPIQ